MECSEWEGLERRATFCFVCVWEEWYFLYSPCGGLWTEIDGGGHTARRRGRGRWREWGGHCAGAIAAGATTFLLFAVTALLLIFFWEARASNPGIGYALGSSPNSTSEPRTGSDHANPAKSTRHVPGPTPVFRSNISVRTSPWSAGITGRRLPVAQC